MIGTLSDQYHSYCSRMEVKKVDVSEISDTRYKIQDKGKRNQTQKAKLKIESTPQKARRERVLRGRVVLRAANP